MKTNQILMFFVFIIGLIFIKPFLANTPEPDDEEREIDDEMNTDNEIDTAINQGQKLTYPKTQYKDFADTIYIALNHVGTDHETVYSVFRKLKNNLDFLELKKAFGTRQVYTFGIPDTFTLVTALRDELSSSQIKKVNDILQSKSIKYRV